MKKLNSKKGVALLLVLSAIVVLTTMAVQFSYDTSVSSHLVNNETQRLKAYYLAKSALNFMMLELKFDRTFQQVVQKQNLGAYLGGNANLPICQQFPLSTALIRAIFTGGGLEALTGATGGGGGDEAAAENEELEEKKKDVTLSDEKSAEAFLNFEGDFDGECINEGTKINLNSFAGLAATAKTEGGASPLDQYKQFLIKFLSQPQFELLFDKEEAKIIEVVNNIADWIDLDDQSAAKGGGIEKIAYERLNLPYPVRNGRLLTLLEAYLIDGVTDDWFSAMMDYFTVYGDGKVDVCTASPEVVEGLIRRYVEGNPNLPPLRLEDPVEMGKLTLAISDACSSGATGNALKSQITQALNTAIGTLGTKPTPAEGGQQEAPVSFDQFVETSRRYFSLKLTGQVNDTVVRIKTVMDVKEEDPKKWKMLYWRVY